MQYTPVAAAEFSMLEGVDDWRYVLGALRTTFGAGSFPAAASLVTSIAEVAERMVHHPDIDLRYRVTCTWSSRPTPPAA